MKIESNNLIKNYAYALLSRSCLCLINQPTRPLSQTLLDHFYCSNLKYYTISGILLYDINDHLPTFSANSSTKKDRSLGKLVVRGMSNFKLSDFINELE